MEFFRGVPFVSRSVGPSVGVLPGPSRHCQTAEWLIASAFQCYIERKNLKRKDIQQLKHIENATWGM